MSRSASNAVVPRNFFLNEQHEMESLFGEIYRKGLMSQNLGLFEVLAWRANNLSKRRHVGVGMAIHRSESATSVVRLSRIQAKSLVAALQEALGILEEVDGATKA